MGFQHAVGILSLLLSSTAVAVPSNCTKGAIGSWNYPNGTANNANASSTPFLSTPSNPSSSNRMTLKPVTVKSAIRTAGRHITPQKNVNLAWQTAGNDSLVTVGLSMQNTAVVLEDITEVVAVDCAGNASVAVTFNTTDAFDEAVSEWGAMNDSFVVITNHLGDCDAELERSFFVADSDTLASFADNLTIVAQAEKKDVASTARKTLYFSLFLDPVTWYVEY